MLRRLLVLITVMLSALSAIAQSPASTPPMGWNSWDAYGLTITEAQFRANVEVLHDKLLPFGWRYGVIDEGWFFENPQDRPKPETLRYAIDQYGRYVPVPARFPSAVGKPMVFGDGYAGPKPRLAATIEETSFKPLADWVHAKGLLFGIHIVRGIPRASVERNLPIANSSFHAEDAADTSDACPWDPTNWGVKDNAAGQAWYDALLQQYADWGVDLLKVDCIADHPYKVSEIRQIRRAIDKTGRNMVLSLSPGPTNPSHATEVASLANMWRISNDFWDLWSGGNFADGFPQSLKGQFDRLATWSQFDFKPGQWPDADMLPLGELRPSPGWGDPRHTRLTPDEQKTLITLWSITQSPLILGANLTMLDRETLKLLTNRGVLDLDQYTSVRGKPVDGLATGDLRVWRVKLKPGLDYTPAFAVALFNLSDAPMKIDRPRTELGFSGEVKGPLAELFDVWAHTTLWRNDRVKLTIPPHGCVLLEGS
ncbi:MAG TPA: glycoside hydrolase family 27 protein [Acidobacteriaceae bacterium]|nr:glycoside hydrolase family 27 protein [Acidobacteriaceae bacterium]